MVGDKRAIFVDFDGVLHGADIVRLDAGWTSETFAPHAIEGRQLFEYAYLLANMLKPHPTIQVIVHSTWRHYLTLAACQRLLASSGLRIDGMTPLLLEYRGPGSARQASIEQYVETHGIADWIVLDDQFHQFDTSWHGQRLIVCDESVGISRQVTQVAIRAWLERASSS